MLLTADHDDRASLSTLGECLGPFRADVLSFGRFFVGVVPLHSFKHISELQHKLPDNPHPLLLRVDTKSGHGAGKSTAKKIEEAVEKYGFVSQSMGLEWHD